jgi:hypothetical protein
MKRGKNVRNGFNPKKGRRDFALVEKGFGFSGKAVSSIWVIKNG